MELEAGIRSLERGRNLMERGTMGLKSKDVPKEGVWQNSFGNVGETISNRLSTVLTQIHIIELKASNQMV